jgi:hypothetical protein
VALFDRNQWHGHSDIATNGFEYEKWVLKCKIFIFFDSKLRKNKFNMNNNVTHFLYALLANQY